MVKNYLLKFKFFTLLSLFSVGAMAQTFQNDICQDAMWLYVAPDSSCYAIQGSFAGASQESPANVCAGLDSSNSAYDQWFKFNANDTTQFVDVTTFTDSVGAVIELYDACGGNLIACANPNAINIGPIIIIQSGQTRLEANGLTIGNDYLVRVYNWGDTLPREGADIFEICVHGSAQPIANDTCAGAFSLFVGSNCFPIVATVAGANEETPATSCGSNLASATANDIWFAFVPNMARTNIDLTPLASSSTGLAAVVELYDTCGNAPIACYNPTVIPGVGAVSAPLNISMTDAVVGQQYMIRIYHYGLSQPSDGNFTLCVYDNPLAPAPSNDFCADAEMLMVYDTCNTTPGTVISATQDFAPDSCNNNISEAAYDVWYTFQAVQETQHVEVSSENMAPVVLVYDACGGNIVACGTATGIIGTRTTAVTASNLTPENYYWVRVYNDSPSDPVQGDFNICVYNAVIHPENDNCYSATTIFPAANDSCEAATSGSLAEATQEMDAVQCDTMPASASAFDVWYSFEANNAVQKIEVTSLTFGAVVELYAANAIDCGDFLQCQNPTLQSIIIDTIALPGTTLLRATGLTSGQTYLARVYAYGDAIPSNSDFTICVYQDTSSVGINKVAKNNLKLETYPNPVNSELNVAFTSSGSYQLTLMDITGKMVYNTANVVATGKVNKAVNTSNLPKGMYLLQLNTGNQIITKKVIKD